MDNATLQSMWFHLQDELFKIAQIHRLINQVKNTTGGALLQKAHELFISQGYFSPTLFFILNLKPRVFSDSMTRDLYRRLLSDASVPYFSLLSSWIHFGIAEDPYDEFQIRVSSLIYYFVFGL